MDGYVRYLVDARWITRWKNFVGFEEELKFGDASIYPGQIDNSRLVKENKLSRGLEEERDYCVVSRDGWNKLVSWYGLADNQHPIARQVIETGSFQKKTVVEVYRLELLLCLNFDQESSVIESFSRNDTLEMVVMRLCLRFRVETVGISVWTENKNERRELTSHLSKQLDDINLADQQMVTVVTAIGTGTFTQHLDEDQRTAYHTKYHKGRGRPQPGVCAIDDPEKNKCYMTTSIQCLSNIPPLAAYFFNEYKHVEESKSRVISTSFALLLEKLWFGHADVDLQDFQNAVNHVTLKFKNCEQHDMVEFLSFLLEQCHLELNEKREVHEVASHMNEDTAAEAWQKYMQSNESVISAMFHGQMTDILYCRDCSTVAMKYEPFVVLPLPIPKPKATEEMDKTVSVKDSSSENDAAKILLSDCFHMLVKAEVLGQQDPWHCHCCGSSGNVHKRYELGFLPKVLLLQLKRFSCTAEGCTKDETFVDFPLQDLDMEPFLPKRKSPLCYDLLAVGHHVGDLSAGHYYAHVKNAVTKHWYKMDRQDVQQISEDAVVSGDAYVLVYARKEEAEKEPQSSCLLI